MVTGVAIVSLAVGMGANAAIFSVFERLVWRQLPVNEPKRLVNLLAPGPKPGSHSSTQAGGLDSLFSYPMFRDLEREQSVFTALAAHRSFGANLSYRGSTLSGEGMFVSGSYFETLGLEPALGRLLTQQDDRTPGAHPVAVLSYFYWADRFGADPAVLDSTLIVNGQPLTIVGVAPRGFDGTTLGTRPRVFVPISMREALQPGWTGLDNRRSYWLYLFGRLGKGVSIEDAEAALNVPYRTVLTAVEAPLQQGLSEQTLDRFRNKSILLEPGPRGQSERYAETRVPVLVLFGVTAVVLLIACVNITHLLLTRATDRAPEIALRLALGARRHQLIGQSLVESLLLSTSGALLGLFVGHATLRWIMSLLPNGNGPEAFGFEMGGAVWLFLGCLAALTGLLGLFPAWFTTRRNLVAALRNQSGQSTQGTAGFVRGALGTLQIAISLTLLIAAGLLSKSLYNLSRADLGLDVEQLVTFGVSPELNGYTPAQSHTLFERLEEELTAIPGVTQATASVVPLIADNNWGNDVFVEGYSTDPDIDRRANFNEVGVGYFRTLGMVLIRGREINSGDVLGTPKVAVVNEAFARRFNIEEATVGTHMRIGSRGEHDIEIVGLVQDAKYSEVKQEVPPQYFLPYRQNENHGIMNFYVCAAGAPELLLPQIRQTVARLDANLPIDNLNTMEQQVVEHLAVDRLLSFLSGAFAAVATFLAAIGLYGVVAYAVAQRTREIGLRMALGADAMRVRRLVLRQVAFMAVPGALLGLALAASMGRIMTALLFELEGHDPTTFASGTLLVGAIAVTAGLIPAQLAASIDPLEALRSE